MLRSLISGMGGSLNTRTRYILVVLLSALIVAFESVAIEGAINTARLNLFLVSSVPLIVGGLILIGTCPERAFSFLKGLGRREWSLMILLSTSYAGAVFLWFGAIGTIGASKAAILGGGSFTVLFTVLLSTFFLGERLNRLEALGGLLILSGVFLVLVDIKTVTFSIGLGEIQTVSAAFLIAVSAVVATMLLKSHDLGSLSGAELFLSGVILILLGTTFGLVTQPDVDGFLMLLILGILPSMGILTFNAALRKIGASLTSVLFALTGVMTIAVQLLVLLVFPDAAIILPRNIALALLGGAIALAGLCLLNRNPSPFDKPCRHFPSKKRES